MFSSLKFTITCMMRAFMVLLLLGFLTGCASMNPSPVADEDRDQSGKFDGRWSLVEHSLGAVQTVAGQRFRCNFEENKTILYVNDSVGRIGRGAGNISTDGRFRIEVLTDNYFRSSVGGSKDERQRITYVFQGKLSTEESTKGLFTKGKKALNNSGCSTRLTIESS